MGIDVRPRLVEQDELWIRRERARERDALLLAAGELVRVAVAEAAEVDEREHDRHARAPLAARQAEADVLGDRQVREERVILEDHAHAAALGRHPRGAVGDDAVADPHLALVRGLEAGDEAQERRLAAAGGAEQRHELTALDAEVGVSHRGHGAEALRDPVDADHPAAHVRTTLQQRFGPVERDRARG